MELYPAKQGTDDKTGLGFSVEDLTQKFEELNSKGFAPQPISKTDWGETFVVRDPDGRRVEVKKEPV